MKKHFLSFITLFSIFISPPAVTKEWTLTNANDGWNTNDLVRLYFHNSDLQAQWAWQALSHYRFRGNEQVLDFGAGDGKLSALISTLVPEGTVIGVDISKEMILFASKVYPSSTFKNLHFLVSNDIDFSGENVGKAKFDLVTSFCVFHLIPNPITVLTQIREKMTRKGKLVITLPIGKNPEFFQAVTEEMTERGWAFPAPTKDSIQMRDPDKIPHIFERAGYKIEYFEVVDTRHPFSTKEELVDWFEGTLTANWNIPDTGRRKFFSDLTDRYLRYRPQDKGDDGFVYFSLKRVDLVAAPIK